MIFIKEENKNPLLTYWYTIVFSSNKAEAKQAFSIEAHTIGGGSLNGISMFLLPDLLFHSQFIIFFFKKRHVT